MIGFNDGEFQELSRIAVPITSLSINRGYGAFEFFEVVGGRTFYGDRHLARFKRSLEILRLETAFDQQLANVVEEVIGQNKLNDAYLKLFALPHETKFEGSRKASLYIFPTQMPVFDPDLYENGAKLVSRNFQRFLPEAKSTNYLSGQYWLDEQTDPRVVDVLYHNGETVQESSRGNIFVVKDGLVITPDKDVLKGITRSLVLELLVAQQMPHEVTDLSLEILRTADEVFLSSTTKHILPITQIDDKLVGNGKPGPVTRTMMQEFALLKEQFGRGNTK